MATATFYPSTHTPTTTGWTNPANAYSASDTNAVATLAVGTTKNTVRGGDFKGFNFSSIPASNVTINSVTIEVRWRMQTTSAIATLGAQVITGATPTVRGTQLTNATEPTTLTAQSSVAVTGLTRAELDANFGVRVTAAQGNSTTTATAELEYVRVVVVYTVVEARTGTGVSTVGKANTGATASGGSRSVQAAAASLLAVASLSTATGYATVSAPARTGTATTVSGTATISTPTNQARSGTGAAVGMPAKALIGTPTNQATSRTGTAAPVSDHATIGVPSNLVRSQSNTGQTVAAHASVGTPSNQARSASGTSAAVSAHVAIGSPTSTPARTNTAAAVSGVGSVGVPGSNRSSTGTGANVTGIATLSTVTGNRGSSGTASDVFGQGSLSVVAGTANASVTEDRSGTATDVSAHGVISSVSSNTVRNASGSATNVVGRGTSTARGVKATSAASAAQPITARASIVPGTAIGYAWEPKALYIQQANGKTEEIPIASFSGRQVVLTRPPRSPIVIDPLRAIPAPTYAIRNLTSGPRPFLVTEKESKENRYTWRVQAINYTDAFYANDMDMPSEDKWPWNGWGKPPVQPNVALMFGSDYAVMSQDDGDTWNVFKWYSNYGDTQWLGAATDGNTWVIVGDSYEHRSDIETLGSSGYKDYPIALTSKSLTSQVESEWTPAYAPIPAVEGGYLKCVTYNPESKTFFAGGQIFDWWDGVYLESAIYASHDAGKTWTKSMGLRHPTGNWWNDEVYKIKYDAVRNRMVACGGWATNGGQFYTAFWESRDNGSTWQEFGPGIPNLNASFAIGDNDVWVATTRSSFSNSACGAYVSKDGGYTWQLLQAYDPSNTSTNWYTVVNWTGSYFVLSHGKRIAIVTADGNTFSTLTLTFPLYDPNWLISTPKGLFTAARNTSNPAVNGPVRRLKDLTTWSDIGDPFTSIVGSPYYQGMNGGVYSGNP